MKDSVCFLVRVIIFYVVWESFVVAEVDIEDEWVDPFDMLNYDRSSKSMIRTVKSGEEIEQNDHLLNACRTSLKTCENKLTEMRSNTSTAESGVAGPRQLCQCSSSNNVEAESKLFMRRFVNILLEAAGAKKVSLERISSSRFDLEMVVTVEQLSVLRKFASDGDVSLRSLDVVFSSALKLKSSWVPDNVLSTLDYLYANFSKEQVCYAGLTLLVPLTAVYMMLMGYSTFSILCRSLLMVFVVGFIITYNRMRQIAEIRSYVYERHHTEVPQQCRPTSASETSWFHWLWSDSSMNLEMCQKYYEAVWLEPGLHVSPDVVLSEMVALFVLHPADLLASSVVKFCNTVLGGLPFGTNWLVLALCMVMFVFVLVLSCGLLWGGQASFLGLHVSSRSQRVISSQDSQEPVLGVTQATRAELPSENSDRPAVTTPQVFNISINLPRRFSFGKMEDIVKSGSVPSLKLTSDSSPDCSGEPGTVDTTTQAERSKQMTAAECEVTPPSQSSDVCSTQS